MNPTCPPIVVALLSAFAAAQDDAPDPVLVVRLFDGEVRIAECWQQESLAAAPRDAAIEHVTVVPMTGGPALADQTVTVARGLIRAIEPAATAVVGEHVVRIDGRGRFLVPGLVDMHVHRLASMSTDLLLLLNGVTSVRDMDGFPWMLRQRRAITDGRLLAPTPYIAGHILNYFPMGIYATVVRTPQAAREAVRAQAKAGYDFIKIHNAMPVPIFDAVCDEARAQHLDVVGHVPHEVSVAHAIESGMRTLEHLKGYVLDSTLQISEEDWLTPTGKAEVWNAPTLYSAVRSDVRGEAAIELLATPELQFVPVLLREQWRVLAGKPVIGPHRGLAARMGQVFEQLLAIHARLLVGTDSGGGYAFMVPGFATLTEMELMEQHGMPALDVLAAATREPAVALRRERDFGTIAAGMRADLVLLGRDPAVATANLRTIEGVMVRGIWLARTDLDRIAASLTSIAAASPTWPAAPAEQQAMVRRHVDALEQLAKAGFVLPTHAVTGYADALDKLGLGDAAGRARATVAIDAR
ncbi:MAG TPA: amidohydrolase family protein [Planctomycetota bacterium]|nr:amidohydrolase family protein [Planctomycetota bacterium]